MHFSDWQLHRQTDGVEDGLMVQAERFSLKYWTHEFISFYTVRLEMAALIVLPDFLFPPLNEFSRQRDAFHVCFFV